MRRLAREPLVHFAVLGTVLFAVHGWLQPAGSPDEIVVTAATLDALRTDHERRTGRAPTREDERALVERYVREEVLFREGLSRDLHQGDPIIRRRIVQKMEIIAEDLAAERDPTEDELKEYVAKHPRRYVVPGRMSFEHVFVREGTDAGSRARAILESLKNGADATSLGDPFLRGREIQNRSRDGVASVFGTAFANAVWAVRSEEWSGPIASTYGQHLVRITRRSAVRDARLADVRNRARADWLRDRRQEATRHRLDELRTRYSVRIEPNPPSNPVEKTQARR